MIKNKMHYVINYDIELKDKIDFEGVKEKLYNPENLVLFACVVLLKASFLKTIQINGSFLKELEIEFEKLTNFEKYLIIVRRFGNKPYKTLKSLSKDFNKTLQRISQLENNAIKKIITELKKHEK